MWMSCRHKAVDLLLYEMDELRGKYEQVGEASHHTYVCASALEVQQRESAPTQLLMAEEARPKEACVVQGRLLSVLLSRCFRPWQAKLYNYESATRLTTRTGWLGLCGEKVDAQDHYR
jgi:hypothetical protein